jgi:carbamoyltransferase
VIDGDGIVGPDGYEAESGFYFENRRGDHRLVFKNRYTDPREPKSGIGWTYEQVSLLLGFGNTSVFIADPGKTMGLAAYGAPREELSAPWIQRTKFKLDFSGFHKWLCERSYESRILSFSGGLAVGDRIDSYAKDVSFKVQAELEDVLLGLARELQQETGAKELCFAGGVALNSVANGRLVRDKIFERVFILPSANDAGQALGLALHGHLLLTKDVSRTASKGSVSAAEVSTIAPMKHACPGRSYDAGHVEKLLRACRLRYTLSPDDAALVEDAAERLAHEEILGWFQGGSEIGPRALGHRSIIANPSPPGMKDKLNGRVKFREGFRPFAPSVLAERTADVFELEGESPYMLIVAPVRPSWQKRVPAITHVDGTARLQTVDRRVDPLYHALISAFCRRTDLPLVLNTSFNLRGMPIVESPYDALGCFLFTELDTLYLGRYRIERPTPDELVPRWGTELVVETGLGPNTTNKLVGKARGGKTRSVSVSDEVLAVLRAFDGKRTIEGAVRVVFESAGPAVLRDVMLVVQELARSGMILIHCGDTIFGESGEGLHWWQTPRKG